jgi:hypothetical protein
MLSESDRGEWTRSAQPKAYFLSPCRRAAAQLCDVRDHSLLGVLDSLLGQSEFPDTLPREIQPKPLQLLAKGTL